MELHFTPEKNHYILYIKGAVLSCCQAIIEMLEKRGYGSVIFEDVDIQAVFNPSDDYFTKERICGVYYDEKTKVVQVMGTSENGYFTETYWEGFNAPDVVGKIYKTLREMSDLEN